MALIDLIETRSGSVNDPNMWIGTLLESPNFRTKSGANITADTALRISAVYACVNRLSRDIASLPMTVNKHLDNGGNEPIPSHPLFPILHDAFCSELTSYEAREMGNGHLELRGNWFNYIERNRGGRIVGIWPLRPDRVKVHRIKGSIWYEHEPADDEAISKHRLYAADEIWHIKGFSTGGLTGVSTIQYARESMGLAASLQDYSAQFFGNKAVPGAILEHPNSLKVDARANLKQSLQEYANSKRHSTLVLEEGMKWQNVGVTNADAQYLEISNAQVRDVARWFDVPLILLHEPDKTSTYASTEQFLRMYAVFSITPRIKRIEQSASRALLSNSERANGYHVKLNMKGLLRGDFKTRMDGYRIAREGGWYSANDIRALEDESPIDNGNIYIQPLNFKEAGTETPIPEAPQPPPEEPKDEE